MHNKTSHTPLNELDTHYFPCYNLAHAQNVKISNYSLKAFTNLAQIWSFGNIIINFAFVWNFSVISCTDLWYVSVDYITYTLTIEDYIKSFTVYFSILTLTFSLSHMFMCKGNFRRFKSSEEKKSNINFYWLILEYWKYNSNSFLVSYILQKIKFPRLF